MSTSGTVGHWEAPVSRLGLTSNHPDRTLAHRTIADYTRIRSPATMRNLSAAVTAVAAILACTPDPGPGAVQGDANAGAQSSYHGLPLVSAPSPFLADCNGPAFPITATYVNAESEPYVAVNPRNPDNLIVVYHQDRFPNDGANGVLASTSFDGGRSWQVPELADQPTFSRCAGGDVSNGGDFEKASDPWVRFGGDGTAYFAAVSWNVSDPAAAQLVATSHDGGLTWETPVTVIRANDPGVSNASRPALTADPQQEQTVYLVWAQSHTAPASRAHGSVGFSRTTDGGRTWSEARSIYDAPTGMQTSANEIVVLPNGDLLNMFTELRMGGGGGAGQPRRDRIAFIRSTDGGLTWSESSTVATSQLADIVDPRTGTKVRVGDSFAHKAVDPRPGSGTIHVAWADARFTNGQAMQIALSTSTDGGLTWKDPVAVSSEPGTQQFIPAIAVNDSGDVAVAWYSFATDTSTNSELMTSYWITWSTDQGESWVSRKPVTPSPFDLRTAPYNTGFFFGEYQGLAAAGQSFVAAVTLTNGHSLQNRTDIYSCLVAPGEPLAANASTVCSPPGAR